MAKPATIKGTEVYIKIGNGADPEVFTHPCLINTQRGIQFQSNGTDVEVPDCDDPSAPAWTDHEKTGLSATITGAGKLDTTSILTYDTWFRGNDAKNVQVWCAAKGYWQGGYKLTDFQVTGDRNGDKAEVSLSLKSHGVVQPYSPQE